jgi:hypothetical protein
LLGLQLLYGLEGARGKFEDLCQKLLCAAYDAHGVRVEQGDGGGIDVFVGSSENQRGIDAYQVKYFPNGLKDAQRQRVRRSFRACVGNPRFRVESWTLCLPLDLSQDEIAWFSRWRLQQTFPAE